MKFVGDKRYLRFSTYIALQAACTSQRHLVSHTGPAFSLGHSPSTHTQTLAYSHTVIGSPSLPF